MVRIKAMSRWTFTAVIVGICDRIACVRQLHEQAFGTQHQTINTHV